MIDRCTKIKYTLRKFSLQNSGFTLLEMVIALGVFIILFSLALGIYSYSIKAEQRTIQVSKLQKEAQLIMEIMTKQIRRCKIDYEYYGGSVDTLNGESELALLDRNNNPVVFSFNSTDQTIEVCTEDCSGSGIFTPIPSQDIFINSLNFFISPATNPFSLSAPPSELPTVTIVMDLINTRAGSTQNLLVQQTIPQRLGGP